MAAANNELCTTIQRNLIDFVPATGPSITNKGFYEALTSPLNRPVTPQIESVTLGAGGKNVTLRARYWQFLPEGAASDTLVDVCVAGTPRAPRSQDYTLGLVASVKNSFAVNDFKEYCERRPDVMNLFLRDAFDKILESKSKQLAIKAASLVLPYAKSLRAGVPVDSATAPADVKLFQSLSPMQISPEGVLDVVNEFDDADVNGAPLLIGQGLLRNYARLAEIACCNENGVEMGELGNGAGGDFQYFKDRNIGTILGGANRFLAIAPGWVQQWTQPKYVGEFAIMKDTYTFNDTVVDPRSGETFDIQTRLSDCDLGQIEVVVSQSFDLFTVPTDYKDPADPLVTYRGAVVFNAI